MRKLLRKAGALIPLLALLCLSGCGVGTSADTQNARLYVEGALKATYLGEFDKDYLNLVELDEEEARASYERVLRTEAEYFIALHHIEYPTREFMEELTQFYRTLYGLADFEVVSAARQDDGSFSVKVDVTPINLFRQVRSSGRLQADLWRFYRTYPKAGQEAMSDEEYRAMDEEYAQMLLKVYEDALPEAGSGAPASLILQLEADKEGNYSINPEDFARLNDKIIDYTGASAGKTAQG